MWALMCFRFAGDFDILKDFKMSTLKPLMPSFLYAGWSRIKRDPDMVIKGWDACGLRCMFDHRRAHVVSRARLAQYDETNEFYPLFPESKISAPPLDAEDDAVKESMMELDSVQPVDQTIEELQQHLMQEDPSALQHVQTLQTEESEASPAATAAPAIVGGRRLCPLFEAPQRDRKRARASGTIAGAATNICCGTQQQ